MSKWIVPGCHYQTSHFWKFATAQNEIEVSELNIHNVFHRPKWINNNAMEYYKGMILYCTVYINILFLYATTKRHLAVWISRHTKMNRYQVNTIYNSINFMSLWIENLMTFTLWFISPIWHWQEYLYFRYQLILSKWNKSMINTRIEFDLINKQTFQNLIWVTFLKNRIHCGVEK